MKDNATFKELNTEQLMFGDNKNCMFCKHYHIRNMQKHGSYNGHYAGNVPYDFCEDEQMDTLGTCKNFENK